MGSIITQASCHLQFASLAGQAPLWSVGKIKQLRKDAYTPLGASHFWLHLCGDQLLITQDEETWRAWYSLPIIQR